MCCVCVLLLYLLDQKMRIKNIVLGMIVIFGSWGFVFAPNPLYEQGIFELVVSDHYTTVPGMKDAISEARKTRAWSLFVEMNTNWFDLIVQCGESEDDKQEIADYLLEVTKDDSKSSHAAAVAIREAQIAQEEEADGDAEGDEMVVVPLIDPLD